jgi:arsenate reductase
MKNVLVLCTGNSCRSQIADGYLRNMLSGKANIYSAGIEAHGLNKRAVAIMQEDGIDISRHTSNLTSDYSEIHFDYIITVCDNANGKCPYFPGKAERLHHSFPDPAKASGTEEEIMAAFRSVRIEIKNWCEAFAKKYF